MSIKYLYGAEDNAPSIAEEGEYPATIRDAEEKTSKAGNSMIEIVWLLESGATIYDYLVFSPKTAYKIDQFLSAIGIAPEKGKELEIVAGALEGKRAYIDVVIEPANKDEDTGKVIWPEKNKVANYVCDKGVPPSEPF